MVSIDLAPCAPGRPFCRAARARLPLTTCPGLPPGCAVGLLVLACRLHAGDYRLPESLELRREEIHHALRIRNQIAVGDHPHVHLARIGQHAHADAHRAALRYPEVHLTDALSAEIKSRRRSRNV